MSKLDEMRKRGAAAAAESMGAGVPPLIPGVSGGVGPVAVPAHLQGLAKVKNVAAVPVDKIKPNPDQPRKEFDAEELDRLAESLKTRGQLQPILVRWDVGMGAYRIICGERRWRAAGMAGLPSLNAVIFDRDLSPSELLTLAVVENCLRSDLQPIERARAFRSLMDLNGWTTRDVASELAIAQPQVVRSLALLELPPAVQARVEDGTLSPATAYEVSKIEDPETQSEVATRAVNEKWSRDETATVVQEFKASKPRESAKGRGASAKGKTPVAKPLRPRTFRLAGGGKVIVEPPKKATDPAVIREMLCEALRVYETEQGGAADAA